MRAHNLTSRAWPPRYASAPPPPPGIRPLAAGHPRALAIAAAMIFSALTAAAQTSSTQPSAYAGSEACQMCHEDIYKAFQKNPHIAVEKDKRHGFATRACESCHGPG